MYHPMSLIDAPGRAKSSWAGFRCHRLSCDAVYQVRSPVMPRSRALARAAVVVAMVAVASLTMAVRARPPAPADVRSPQQQLTAPSDTRMPTTARPADAVPNAAEIAATLNPGDFVQAFAMPAPGGPVISAVDGRSVPFALETVGGITVHARMAPIIGTLLAEAEVAGVALEGGGYRTREAQWRLRVQNCPDPVRSPASACSPPTAPVGRSLHESGLAVDFTSAGELIVDRTHPAYRFLAAQGPGFGLQVHPQEPWHWSFRP